MSAERGFPEGVSAVKPGVARIGDIAQGKLIGLEANLSALWEWSELPGAWSVTSKYLCGLREGFSHTVSLPQLVRRKIPVSIAGRGGLSFEYANVIAHVAVSDGESCGVSIVQEREVWRRIIEPRGLARKWGDSFLFYGAANKYSFRPWALAEAGDTAAECGQGAFAHRRLRLAAIRWAQPPGFRPEVGQPPAWAHRRTSAVRTARPRSRTTRASRLVGGEASRSRRSRTARHSKALPRAIA